MEPLVVIANALVYSASALVMIALCGVILVKVVQRAVYELVDELKERLKG